MVLVSYSDSDSEEAPPSPPAAKKRKVDDNAPRPAGDALPPLPNAFHDMYSSTVRMSTQDDPSLHGGRKRVTPHVEGNWPTHVYLEWHPSLKEAEVLSSLISERGNDGPNTSHKDFEVHSLLHNDLGVSLPLHVSLSRPLVLRTEQRDTFVNQLKQAIAASGAKQFSVKPGDALWHPNESRSRWFQVIGLQRPAKDELRKLLNACNGVASAFEQPQLYDGGGDCDGKGESLTKQDQFHISIAWALHPPDDHSGMHRLQNDAGDVGKGAGHWSKLEDKLNVHFTEIKVRIGQDVSALPLVPGRSRTSLFT